MAIRKQVADLVGKTRWSGSTISRPRAAARFTGPHFHRHRRSAGAGICQSVGKAWQIIPTYVRMSYDVIRCNTTLKNQRRDNKKSSRSKWDGLLSDLHIQHLLRLFLMDWSSIPLRLGWGTSTCSTLRGWYGGGIDVNVLGQIPAGHIVGGFYSSHFCHGSQESSAQLCTLPGTSVSIRWKTSER